ncbi:MAG: hypothetical protein WCI92_00250 [Bacteroidota bacterium]
MKKTLILPAAILVLTLALVQTACTKDSGTNNEYPNVTANADTVNGILKFRQTDTAGITLLTWPFGPAMIKALVGETDELASATVNADGTFQLVLPASVPGKYLSSLAGEACRQGGSLKATPVTVRFLDNIQYKVEYVNNGTPTSFIAGLHTLKTDMSIDKSYFFNFYDLDGVFQGTGTAGNTYNWTFTKGWGMVESYKISATSSSMNSRSVSSIPSYAVWVN